MELREIKATALDRMLMDPQNVYVEILTPNVRVLGSMPSVDDSVMRSWMGFNGSLQKRPQRALSPHLLRWEHGCPANQEVGSQQSRNLPWSWTSRLPNCEKRISVVYQPLSLWHSVSSAWTDRDKLESKKIQRTRALSPTWALVYVCVQWARNSESVAPSRGPAFPGSIHAGSERDKGSLNPIWDLRWRGRWLA